MQAVGEALGRQGRRDPRLDQVCAEATQRIGTNDATAVVLAEPPPPTGEFEAELSPTR
jgi:hypothetical protein